VFTNVQFGQGWVVAIATVADSPDPAEPVLAGPESVPDVAGAEPELEPEGLLAPGAGAAPMGAPHVSQ